MLSNAHAELDCKWPLSRGGEAVVDGWLDVSASTVDERYSTVVRSGSSIRADGLSGWLLGGGGGGGGKRSSAQQATRKYAHKHKRQVRTRTQTHATMQPRAIRRCYGRASRLIVQHAF